MNEKKTAVERTHELLLEMAKSNSLWLQYGEVGNVRRGTSDMSTGIQHAEYLSQLVEKISNAYYMAELRQRTSP